jgi:hypothetical protein
MNDMTNHTMSDDAVIARLRSALDEVAATTDDTVVTLRTSVRVLVHRALATLKQEISQ